MVFHSLFFRVFVNATEDENKVIKALQFVSGTKEFKRSLSTGYHGNPITILESILRKKSEIDAFLNRLSLGDLKKIIDTLERRMDDEGFVYFRFDKQLAYHEQLVLTDGEDVIAVKGKAKAYPSTYERAINAAREYFESLIKKKSSNSSSQTN
ncbi:MAG: RNA-binding domain-containing protein [Methanomassiliicoccales archaeon]|jgi:RNA binding exosome subunit|nr:RNA-binding domain-containing protein [Methanomassiliicoccales archaeon]